MCKLFVLNMNIGIIKLCAKNGYRQIKKKSNLKKNDCNGILKI